MEAMKLEVLTIAPSKGTLLVAEPQKGGRLKEHT